MKIPLKIISVLMSLIIVFSSTGIVVSRHLCDGELQDIAWFQDAEPCEHGNTSTAVQCPVHEDMVIQVPGDDNTCCEDTRELVREEDPRIESTHRLDLSFQPLVLMLAFNLSGHLYALTTNTVEYNSLPLPPLISQDLPVLHQVFRL